MAHPPKSYLLEQLRVQADSVSARRVQEQRLSREVRFDPDFVNESIIVTLRNVDRFEPVVFDFHPDALETPVLDDLVNLMLGKPSQFLLRAPLRGFGR